MAGSPYVDMSRARSALVGLLIAAPFYLLLIDTTSTPELWAGAAAAVSAAGAYGAAYLESNRNAAIRARWLLAGLRELAGVPAGIWMVCGEVLRQTFRPRASRGNMEVEPFPVGAGDAHDLGRRALNEALRSLTPSLIVLGVDPDSDRLISHRMGAKR